MKPELINSLKGYKSKYLVNDIMSGLLVALIAMPLSIALGIQSVPAEVSSNGLQMGLITAIVGGIFISMLGGSRFQVGGPTASFFIIIYNYILNPDIGIIGMQFCVLMAGIWLIILGLCKAGKIIDYFPYPIVIGFTAGVGITIMGGQLKDFFGIKAFGASFMYKMVSLFQNINTFNWAAFMIGVIGLAIIIIIQKINRKIPGSLIAIIVCTIITVILNNTVGDLGIETIGTRYGNIKAEFYFIKFGNLANVKIAKLIAPSFIIALLCMIESLLSAKVADGMANTVHNPNQELLGQGVANIFSSIFGGLPAIGAIARTSANIRSGAKSSLAGIFHSLFILIMYFALMGVVKYIPFAVFASILIMVAVNMSNFPLFMRILKFGYKDCLILLSSFFLTIFLDMIYGVVGGILLTVLVNIPNFTKKLEMERIQDGESVTFKLKGAVYFISVNKIVENVEKELKNASGVEIDMLEIKEIDQSSLEKIMGLANYAKARNKGFKVKNCNEKIEKSFKKFGYSI